MSLSEIRNLDHTVILCRRLEETRAFYRDVMKFPIEVERGSWTSFRVGSSLLSLRPRGVWSVCDDGELPEGSAALQIAFRVPPAALEACHAELLAAGVAMLRELTDLPAWRHRALFFRDPEQNIIEVYAEY